MQENISFEHHSADLQRFSLHDARISDISIGDQCVDFRFQDGLLLTESGECTKEALLRVKTSPEDVNVYLTTRQKLFCPHTEKYKSRSISLKQVSRFLQKGGIIEIVDCFSGILDTSLWRCASLYKSRGYTPRYFEFQFCSDSEMEYEIFYN